MLAQTQTLVLLISISALSYSFGNPIWGRIVNGTDAKPGEIPYIVSLRFNNRHTCGGSILDSTHILTAAHCLDKNLALSYSIQYGEIYIDSGENALNVIQVTDVVPHPKFENSRASGYINDVGVVKLAKPIEFSNFAYQTVLAPRLNATPENEEATLSGWGALYTGNVGSPFLQTVQIQVFPDKTCEDAFSDGAVSRDYHICAGIVGGGKGQCNGDSGGPLVVHGVQVGIVSWSVKPCTRPEYPGVFTKVSTHIDWIKQQIAEL